jgi:hypothetical protein
VLPGIAPSNLQSLTLSSHRIPSALATTAAGLFRQRFAFVSQKVSHMLQQRSQSGQRKLQHGMLLPPVQRVCAKRSAQAWCAQNNDGQQWSTVDLGV